MTDRAQRDLDYGQLGEPIYNVERHEWTAHRATNAISRLVPLTGQSSHHQIASHHDLPHPVRQPQRDSTIRDAVEAFPVLQPAVPFISRYLAQDADRICDDDALLGDLLAITYTRKTSRVDNARRRRGENKSCPVLVSHGSTGNRLRFTEMIRKRMGWNDQEETWLEAHHLVEKSSVTWTSPGDPILQICSSDETAIQAGSDLVAVRLPTIIQVFRPLYGTAQSNNDHGAISGRSRSFPLDPNPIVTISRPSDPGSHCADVAFNPWDPNQLAVISSLGTWTVWAVSRRDAKLIAQSSVIIDEHSDSDEQRGSRTEDAWHRVSWCLDSYHILACDRLRLQLFDGSGKRMCEWKLRLTNADRLISDVRRSVRRDDHIFVTTTERVDLLGIRQDATGLTIECLSSWRHHRDPSDLTLSLSLSKEDLFHYSQRHALVTAFRLDTGRNTDDYDTLALEPSRFRIPGPPLLGLTTMPVDRRGTTHSRRDLDERPLIQVITLDTDLEIAESIHCSYHPSTVNLEPTPTPPTWQRTIKDSMPLSSALVTNGFIVADNEDSSGDDSPRPLHTADKLSTMVQANKHAFSVPNQQAYDQIVPMPMASGVDLADLLHTLPPHLAADKAPLEYLKTLGEQISGKFQIPDIESASIAATELLRQPSQVNTGTAAARHVPLATPVVLGFASLGIYDVSLSAIYSRLAAYWLRSLPRGVPTRARLDKERMLRQVAASLFLASNGVQPPMQDDSAPLEADETESQPEPTRSSDASASIPKASTSPALQCLRQYTNVEAAPQASSNSVSRILDHWDIGEDPATYDHTAHVVPRPGADGHDSQSEAETRKTQRREERKKLNREESSRRKRAKIGRDPNLVQSQPDPSRHRWSSPPAVSQSDRPTQSQTQQSATTGPDLLSQPTTQPFSIASQQQSGKFGGRLALRGKRKAGF